MLRLALLLLLTAHAVLAYKYLPYQAHGFNDLDYFTQLLIKGVDFFKLDLSPQVREQCLQQSTWDTSMNVCEPYSNGFEICCLAFRGDTSSIPIFKQPFNISTELVDLLKNPRYNHILKRGAKSPYDSTIRIAINFQFKDSGAELPKQFLYSLMKTIEENDLDVEFITGTDDFVYHFLDKCQSGSCDEVEKYIAKAPIYLQTGSYSPPTRYGEQRFRNFNVFYRSIQDYCRDGFPKWITDYQFPMVFWEPSHEFQVQYTREMWESPDCKLGTELKNPERFRISSNLEPEMVQVYWKKPIFELTPTFNPEDEKVTMIGEYHDSAIDYSDFCQQFVMGLNSGSSNILRIYDDNFKLLNEIEVSFHIKFVKSQADKLLVQGDTDALLIRFDNLNGQCSIKQQEVLKSREYEIIALSHNSNELIYFDTDPDSESISLTFIDIDTKEKKADIKYALEETMKTPTMNLGFDAYYSKNTNTYHIAITFTKYGLMSEKLLTLTNQVKIYLSLLEISSQYQIIDHIKPVHHVDFGTTNDLKLYELNDQMYLLAVHTNGLCQSAILLNNNEWNKCIYENYAQYSAISNVPYMINYFWGNLEQIKERVETGHKINGCDLEIMHAKIGNGDNPSITLRMKDGVLQAFVIADFIPYEDQTPFTQLFCGSSNDYGKAGSTGLMLFSYDLVHPRELELI